AGRPDDRPGRTRRNRARADTRRRRRALVRPRCPAGRGSCAARSRHAGPAGLRPRRPPRARERHGSAPTHRRAAQAARRVRPHERRGHVQPRRELHRQAEERLPLIRVSVSVARDALEELRARFVELAPDGFEENERGERVELAAYGDAAERVLDAFPHAETSEVAAGWEDRWREFHRSIRVGPLWVGPPWEEPPRTAV